MRNTWKQGSFCFDLNFLGNQFLKREFHTFINANLTEFDKRKSDLNQVVVMKSTNYYNTFIEIAEDCNTPEAEIPKQRSISKTVPVLQHEIVAFNPYKFTSDDVLFMVFALRNNLSKQDPEERKRFFSKSQACFRASSLGKRYGWGIHFDHQGKMALYARESKEYQNLKEDKNIRHLRAMRSKRTG